MSYRDMTSPFLPLPDGIVIASVHPAADVLTVHIAYCSSTAACPLCQQASSRIHGEYARTVADLPCGGRRVILSLTVRKFACGTSTCPRQIFTERLADLVQPYARMTNRLRETLIALGLATSAEVSERVVPELAMRVSAPTLLRRLRQVACPPPKHCLTKIFLHFPSQLSFLLFFVDKAIPSQALSWSFSTWHTGIE